MRHFGQKIGNNTGAAWGAITGTLSSQTDLQAALDAKQSAVLLVGETEMIVRDADSFAAWPNGWADESTGGTNAPRVFNERMVSGSVSSNYTVFESTGGTNLLQITSPPFLINSNKTLWFRMDCRTFAGTPAVNAYIIGYEGGGDTSTGYVQFLTGYNPGGSWATAGVGINPSGGASPSLPATCDRAVIQLTLASNNNIKFGIRDVYLGQEALYPPGGVIQPSTGGHEAVFDGTNVFVAIFFSGYIAKLNLDGTGNAVVTTGGGVNAHQVISDGSYLYLAEWDAHRITKRLKTASPTPVASVATTSEVFSVCILDGNLFASTVDKTLYKIRLSDFSLLGTYTIATQNNSSTQATLIPLNGYLWMHTAQDGKVLKIDPANGTVAATINPPSSFGTSTRNYGFGQLNGKLYLSFHNGTLVEYDPATATISRQWDIGAAATSQIKNDGTNLWFVGQTPYPYLARFNPVDGITLIRMRKAGGGKWCEVVGDEVWCGGFDSGRVERFVRF